MVEAKKKGPRAKIEAEPEKYEWTEAAESYFEHTLEIPEHLDVDERSAYGTIRLETTENFPREKKAENIAVLVHLNTLPPDGTMTIGPKNGIGKGFRDSFLKLDVGGTLKHRENPDGSERLEKDWKTSVDFEIKTGVFAALDLKSVDDPNFCVKRADLASHPSAAKDVTTKLKLEVRYDLSLITLQVIGTQEIDEELAILVED